MILDSTMKNPIQKARELLRTQAPKNSTLDGYYYHVPHAVNKYTDTIGRNEFADSLAYCIGGDAYGFRKAKMNHLTMMMKSRPPFWWLIMN